MHPERWSRGLTPTPGKYVSNRLIRDVVGGTGYARHTSGRRESYTGPKGHSMLVTDWKRSQGLGSIIGHML